MCRVILVGGDKNKIDLLAAAMYTVCSGVEFIYVAHPVALNRVLLEGDNKLIKAFVIDSTPAFAWAKHLLPQIRRTKAFEKTPVVVMADNLRSEDIAYTFKYGAHKYIVRPATHECLLLFVRLLILESSSFRMTRPSPYSFVMKKCT